MFQRRHNASPVYTLGTRPAVARRYGRGATRPVVVQCEHSGGPPVPCRMEYGRRQEREHIMYMHNVGFLTSKHSFNRLTREGVPGNGDSSFYDGEQPFAAYFIGMSCILQYLMPPPRQHLPFRFKHLILPARCGGTIEIVDKEQFHRISALEGRNTRVFRDLCLKREASRRSRDLPRKGRGRSLSRLQSCSP